MSVLKMYSKRVFVLFIILPSLVHSLTYLRAAGVGKSEAYKFINSVWGSGATQENPDCSHRSFGPHISQGNDEQLKKPVFFFAIHANVDNDNCHNFDRQRLEIRPDEGDLTGRDGDSMSLSWIFKLPKGFQPSDSFTHIFQLKASGGKDGHPIITFSPRRKSSGNILELIYRNDADATTKLKSVDLAPFIDTWIQAKVNVTYGKKGKLSCSLSVFNGSKTLLTYSNTNIEIWRKDASFYRGKYGIYRSLNNKNQLRDEIVRFDDFCIAKGEPQCK